MDLRAMETVLHLTGQILKWHDSPVVCGLSRQIINSCYWPVLSPILGMCVYPAEKTIQYVPKS